MFCPRCGSENLEEASFCRACGADISLVSQALAGRVDEALSPATDSAAQRGKQQRNKQGRAAEKSVTYEKAYENLFIGVAFLFVAGAVYAFMPGGFVWWFWMLIPAFACFGKGYGQIKRLRHEERSANTQPPSLSPLSTSIRSPALSASPAASLNARDTADMKRDATLSPPSVTEGTTRLLDDAPALSVASRNKERT